VGAEHSGIGRIVPTAEAMLAACAVFAAASPLTSRVVASRMRRRTFGRGEVIALETGPADRVWIVESGMLRVFMTSLQGDEACLAVLTAGDIAGEMGVLAQAGRSTSIAALRPSVAWELPGDAFSEAFHSDAAVARAVAETLVQRLRATTTQVNDLHYLDLGGRVAKYLLGCGERLGDEFDLTLNQSELGQLVGGARQTVNQLIRSLELANLIAVNGRRVRIVDRDGLSLRALSAT
jgi:CRP/FNR family transcriptional regulator, cyclic AMP receptor protein